MTMKKSDLAARMEYDAPSDKARVVSGAKSEPDNWRTANAKRSIERDRISPGTRAAR